MLTRESMRLEGLRGNIGSVDDASEGLGMERCCRPEYQALLAIRPSLMQSMLVELHRLLRMFPMK